MQTEFLERRITNRIDIVGETKYKILSSDLDKINFGYEKGKIKNISKGGICILIPHKIEEGIVLRVEINVTNSDNRIIKAFCEVEWCNLENSAGLYEIGLSFIALKEEDQKFLEQFISETHESCSRN